MENNENMNKKCELTDDELAAVAGGSGDETWMEGDWCSYESIKDQLPAAYTHFAGDLACLVTFVISSNSPFPLLAVQLYMHYLTITGEYITKPLGTEETVVGTNAVKIERPSWA